MPKIVFAVLVILGSAAFAEDSVDAVPTRVGVCSCLCSTEFGRPLDIHTRYGYVAVATYDHCRITAENRVVGDPTRRACFGRAVVGERYKKFAGKMQCKHGLRKAPSLHVPNVPNPPKAPTPPSAPGTPATYLEWEE